MWNGRELSLFSGSTCKCVNHRKPMRNPLIDGFPIVFHQVKLKVFKVQLFAKIMGMTENNMEQSFNIVLGEAEVGKWDCD